MFKASIFSYLLFAATYTAVAQQEAAERAVITCTLGTNCSTRYVDGRRVLTIRDQGVVVSADLTAQKRFTRASVAVQNSSAKAVDVLPTNFQLLTKQGGKTYAALAWPAVQKIESHRDSTWANFFDMGPAATKNETVVHAKRKDVTSNADPGADKQKSEVEVTEITVPDEEARAAARERIQGRKDQLAQDCLKMQNSYLRASTVDAGDSIAGLVYFPPTRAGEAQTLSVLVGARRYEFPLVADAEE